MSITSITRDTQNNVSIVRIITTNTLAEVLGANYITNQMPNIRALNSGSWQWYATDMLLVSASDGNAFFTFINSDFSSLHEYSGGSSGIVTSGLKNQMAWYAANGSTISGLATALNSVLTTDGSGVPGMRTTLPAGLTIPGYATAPQIQQQAFTYGVDSGTANAVQINLSPAIGAYTDGMGIEFKANSTNTGATTISLNGLGAVPLVLNGNIALTGSEKVANRLYQAMYNIDHTAFYLLNPSLSDSDVQPANIQDQDYTFNSATGTANAILLSLSPSLSAYQDGQAIVFKATANNTGATTINVNGNGVSSIVTNGNHALVGGEILTNGDYYLVYNASYTAFVLINSSLSSGGGVTAAQVQNQSFDYSVDSGAVNSYAATLSPAPSSYVDGLFVILTPTNSNTGASTLNVNGLGARNIITNNNNLLSGGEMLAGLNYYLLFQGGTFQLLNQSGGVVAKQIQNQSFTYGISSGVLPNTYSITLSPAITAYQDGQAFIFKASGIGPNTASSTLNVNGLGAKTIFTLNGGSLTGGEIINGFDYLCIYSSTNNGFILINSSTTINALNTQQQTYTYILDTGAANAYVATLPQAPISYSDGLYVCFRAANANTGASTINVNGLGAQNIVTNSNGALVGGEILANGDYILIYNNSFSAFVIVNSSLSAGGVTSAQVQQQAFTWAADSGAANAYAVTLSPAPGSYTNGMYVSFRATNANTASSTMNVNGLGAITINSINNNAVLVGGEILANTDYIVIYDSGAFYLINPSGAATKVGIQRQSYTFATSTGTANALVVTLNPAITVYIQGLYVSFKANANNTGATTINVNGLGVKNIVLPSGSTLVGGEIISTLAYSLIYNGSNFELLNPSTMVTSTSTLATKVAVQQQSYTYAVDSGAANTYIVALTPALTSYVDGEYVAFKASNTNTGASTINVNGLGARNIVTNSNAALLGGEILINGDYILIYNGTFGEFVIINPSNVVSTSSVQSSVVPSGSAITLSTSNSPANVTTLTLTQNGTYLVWGNIGFTPQGGGVADFYSWVSSTSATLPDLSLYNRISTATVITNSVGIQTPQIEIVVSSAPQTVYLSAQATFGIGVSCTACGGLYAELL